MTRQPARMEEVTDVSSGLHAFIVLDDLTLGPAAGGVRTLPYPSPEHALADARALARTMTIKCALSGLDAGGGKAVVMDHPDLRRDAAFEMLGACIQALDGDFRTAGDAGTGPEDLMAMSRSCTFVHTGESTLADAVARGAIFCMAPLRARLGLDRWADTRVAIQGCGAIGGALARALTKLGAEVYIADVNGERVQTLAAETGCKPVEPEEVLTADVDILAPCALGGVIDNQVAQRIRARAVCGAANNVMANLEAERVLVSRGIWIVPDVLVSAGAVIDGIGNTVMGLEDRAPLIRALETRAEAVLTEARLEGTLPSQVAEAHAWRRIDRANTEREHTR